MCDDRLLEQSNKADGGDHAIVNDVLLLKKKVRANIEKNYSVHHFPTTSAVLEEWKDHYRHHRARVQDPSLLVSPLRRKRKLDTPCDTAFLNCLIIPECLSCFQTLGDEGIDWAGVSPETPCDDVLALINKAGHCAGLKDNSAVKGAFCEAFNSCVMWDDKSNEDGGKVDCAKLKKCEWKGIHRNFLGDGICQQDACYNTKICEWDGGDCCKDTCESRGFNEVSAFFALFRSYVHYLAN